MEARDKLKELNLTPDEVERFTKAFKDEKFLEMLRDYAAEISDPDNKKIYEEEIKLLEQERGFSVDFIHPTPFRVIKTSVDGKQKCFINICGNDNAGKPASKIAVSEEGRRGQTWSLPHILHPGRQDTDPKGIKFMIYDVIFHPDTLHIASKNKRFMDMVVDTAIQGIQGSFKVMLDKNNVREMRTKYKGTPQPCVIRKPIPEYKANEPADQPDLLTGLYPDDRQPQKMPKESPSKNSSDVKPSTFQIQPEKTKEPTKPKYTVKYRSFIDLQDFRCSRDSAQSPRPKEIIITIDLPLLRSVRDTSLEVNEKSLLLESQSPAYRLALPLSFPVDEDKGEAKFNKQKGQLTVTLPVRPPNVACNVFVGPTTSESDPNSESEEEMNGVKEKGSYKDQEGMRREKMEQTAAEKRGAEKSCMEKCKTRSENGEEEKENEEKEEQGQKVDEKEKTGEEGEKCEQLEKKNQESKEKECGLKAEKSSTIPESEENEKTEKLKEQVNEDVEQLTKQDKQDKDNEMSYNNKSNECDRSAESVDSCIAGDSPVLKIGISEVEKPVAASCRSKASFKTENQHISIYNEHSNILRENKENPSSRSESASEFKSSEIQMETEMAKHVQGSAQVRQDVVAIILIERWENRHQLIKFFFF